MHPQYGASSYDLREAECGAPSDKKSTQQYAILYLTICFTISTMVTIGSYIKDGAIILNQGTPPVTGNGTCSTI